MGMELGGVASLTIAVFDEAGNAAAAEIGHGLAAEVADDFGARGEAPLSVVATSAGSVVGGLSGATHWGWCYIRHFWVRPDWRRRGVGGRLLAEVEALALARGCAGLYVDTFNPRAAALYERAGYERFGEIANFPPGHRRIYLSKPLSGAATSPAGRP